MSFFSLEFSVLMTTFFGIYWLFKDDYKTQNVLILVFSYLVYTLMSPYFALILLSFTFFIHFFALLIYVRRKRFIFGLCISFVILNLCFFKYYDSVRMGAEAMLNFFGLEFIDVDLFLPIGMSFYTFNSITYLVVVYKQKRLISFVNLATYLSFFPILTAGPIMRSENFFAQALQKREFKHMDLIFVLLLFGIIKKVLIANYLQIYSSEILNDASSYNTMQLISAIWAYAVQIYCDFSGYVDLVTAFGLMLGFTLPLNFNMPYLARNLKDFWNRWHISLSHFVRDYIYIALGGNQKGQARTIVNLMIAFILSGLWHGSTINFLIWGLLHGLGVVFIHLIKNLNFTLNIIVARFLTINFVCFAWIFFYYPSLNEAYIYLKSCVDNFFIIPQRDDYYMFFGFVLLFFIYPLFINFKDYCVKAFELMPLILKPFFIAFVLILIFILMPNGIPSFIYFAF